MERQEGRRGDGTAEEMQGNKVGEDESGSVHQYPSPSLPGVGSLLIPFGLGGAVRQSP